MENREELSERKKLILKAIIDSHIESGEPVGSKHLVDNLPVSCSSATIRNEMAELQDMGYLVPLHTSSGRVPSEKGYRFYVDSLIEHYAMTANEIGQINDLLKRKMAELDQILVDASKVASNLTNYTAFAVQSKPKAQTFKRFDCVYLDGHSFILVMVTSSNRVKTKNIYVDGVKLSGDLTDCLANALNEKLVGITAEQITLPVMIELEKMMSACPDLIHPVMKVIYAAMDENEQGELKISGVDRLLQYPELSSPERMKDILSAIENKQDFLSLVTPDSGDDIGIVIGKESAVKVMDHSAVVYKPIVRDGKTVGAIGVLGPVRMDYAKVMATLEGISDQITGLIDSSPGGYPPASIPEKT